MGMPARARTPAAARSVCGDWRRMPFPFVQIDSTLFRGRTRRTGLRLLGSAVLACSLVLGACTSLPRTPYSAADASNSRVLDIDGLRRYTDEPITKFSFPVIQSYLALSGGGADGAYGVGVLNGWSAAG